MEDKQTYELATTAPQERPITPAIWNMISKEVAPVLGRAHMMSADKMSSVLLKGYELGLSMTASIELVQNVQGKTSLAPRGALALVQNSPLIKDVKINRLDDKGKFIGYECKIERMNGFAYTARWTMEQARAAGLVKADSGWEKYPENMCMWRAVGFACDVAASDITCGLTAFLKMPEQYNIGIDDGGNIVDAVVTPAAPRPDPVVTEVERLCNVYGAEAVLLANNGQIPASLEECLAAEKSLLETAEDVTD